MGQIKEMKFLSMSNRVQSINRATALGFHRSWISDCENYRDSRVMMAAGALIHLYHNSPPDISHRDDAIQPTEADLVCDLAEYKKNRDSTVVMAAGALIRLYDSSPTDIAHKKDHKRLIPADVHDWTECRHRCDFSVMKAAKTLIHLYRNSLLKSPKTTKKRKAERPAEAIFTMKLRRHSAPEKNGDDLQNNSDDSEYRRRCRRR